jgi:hypothetical protein
MDAGGYRGPDPRADRVTLPTRLVRRLLPDRLSWGVHIQHLPVSFVCALATMLAIYTDSGAGPNHLLDMVVLTVILIG